MSSSFLDTKSNRASTKYTAKENIIRILWAITGLFFRLSPRHFFGWRNFLLRLFGAKIGRNVHIYNTAVITLPWNIQIDDWSSIGEHALIYNLGKVTIGSSVTVSQRVHLCAGTHDHTKPDMPLLKPPIIIANSSWICADAFVGPGVTVDEGAVVGARGVVTKDVPAWSIVAGNPAVKIGERKLEK